MPLCSTDSLQTCSKSHCKTDFCKLFRAIIRRLMSVLTLKCVSVFAGISTLNFGRIINNIKCIFPEPCANNSKFTNHILFYSIHSNEI